MSKSMAINKKDVIGFLALMAMCLMVALAAVAVTPDSAHAAAFRKGYTISAGNTTVYSNTSLTRRYGAIYASDEVTVLAVTSSYTRVNYPVSRGRTKTGYIPTRAMLTATRGTTYRSRAKFSTYKRPGGTVYGYVASGDSVLVLGTSGGGGYTQIKYPVSGGYKYAFTPTSNVNAYLRRGSTSSGNANNNSVDQRLNAIANGSLRYNSWTNMRLGTRFTGTRAGEQCKGFAKNVFYMCFKVTPGPTRSKPYNYLLNATGGMTRIGYWSNITAVHAHSLFSKARPGDFVQIRRRSSGGSHSAIVYSVNSTGVTFFEANTDGRNTVMRNTYSWSQLASRNRGMSLYTASSYGLK